MIARWFHLVFDDGESVPCAAFASEPEAARAKVLLAGAHLRPAASSPTPADPPGSEPRPRGRPSYSAMIEAAAAQVEAALDGCDSLSARARRVLKQLAQSRTPAELPTRDTVERYLRKKERKNWRHKSRGPKIGAGG